MMDRQWGLRARHLIAAFVALGGASPVFAQAPPAPFPVMTPAEAPIEIYYGAAKVSPPAPVPEPPPVIPTSAPSEPANPDRMKPAEAIVEALHSVRDGTRDISAAAVGLLGKVGDRVKHTTESRPIILASYTMPAMPMPVPHIPVAANPAPAQPQVVVVRESVPTPVPAAPRGMSFTVEALVAFGVGIVGSMFAMMAWSRGSRKAVERVAALPPASAPQTPLDPKGVQLMGQYNAGAKREDAEKFELGPTFHDELKQKKQAVEASNHAAVEFILNQNLALLAALNPADEGKLAMA